MGRVPFARGHILHEGLEARLQPTITGPIGRGRLHYTPIYLTAQSLTKRPIKFGTITAELLGLALKDTHYKSRRERILAIADALNAELADVVAGGCTVIQLEEPQLHLAPLRGAIDQEISLDFLIEVFNRTVKGLREKAEVWGHSCWGNPSQQRMFASNQSYKPSLEYYERCDADVLTFETCTSGGMDLEAIGKTIKSKKIAIGVIDHHTLQVETPDEVAALIRTALKHIPAGAARDLVGLRHGTRGHEPQACLFQDGRAGAGHEHRPPRARPAGGRMPRRRSALFADAERRVRGLMRRAAGYRRNGWRPVRAIR